MLLYGMIPVISGDAQCIAKCFTEVRRADRESSAKSQVQTLSPAAGKS